MPGSLLERLGVQKNESLIKLPNDGNKCLDNRHGGTMAMAQDGDLIILGPCPLPVVKDLNSIPFFDGKEGGDRSLNSCSLWHYDSRRRLYYTGRWDNLSFSYFWDTGES